MRRGTAAGGVSRLQALWLSCGSAPSTRVVTKLREPWPDRRLAARHDGRHVAMAAATPGREIAAATGAQPAAPSRDHARARSATSFIAARPPQSAGSTRAILLERAERLGPHRVEHRSAAGRQPTNDGRPSVRSGIGLPGRPCDTRKAAPPFPGSAAKTAAIVPARSRRTAAPMPESSRRRRRPRPYERRPRPAGLPRSRGQPSRCTAMKSIVVERMDFEVSGHPRRAVRDRPSASTRRRAPCCSGRGG